MLLSNRFIALAPIVFLLVACAPEPDAVCEHMAELMVGTSKNAASAALLEDAKHAGRAECVQGMARLKEKDRSGYKKVADCIVGAGTLSAMNACMSPAK